MKISQRIELFFVLGVHFRTGEPQWQAYTEPEPGQKVMYIVDRGSQVQVDEAGVYLVEFAHTVLSGSTLSIISVFIIEKVACSTRLVNFKWINSTWIAIETKGNLVTRYVASSPAHQELIGGSPWASNGVSRWKIGLLGVVLWEDNLRIIQVKPLKPVYVERKVDMTIPRRGPSQSTPTHRHSLPKPALVRDGLNRLDRVMGNLTPLPSPRPTAGNKPRKNAGAKG